MPQNLNSSSLYSKTFFSATKYLCDDTLYNWLEWVYSLWRLLYTNCWLVDVFNATWCAACWLVDANLDMMADDGPENLNTSG